MFLQGDTIWVSVGSDQTDRDLETYNIEKSKQMCEKPVANLAAIDATRNISGKYSKIHLVPMMDEEKYLTPGDTKGIFELSFGKAGAIVCYDLRFTELPLLGILWLLVQGEILLPKVQKLMNK